MPLTFLVVDKMIYKNEERLVVTFPVSLLASSRNTLVGISNGDCQTVSRDGVSPEVAANLSKNIFLGKTSPP